MSRPVPLERKKLLGNPGKRAIPQPVGEGLATIEEIPPVPVWLGTEGRKHWVLVWTFCRAWLTTSDEPVVTRYCEAQQLMSDLRQQVALDGTMVEGSMKQQVLHPALTEMRGLSRELLRMEAALGMTPADRAKLGIALFTMAEKKSRLDEFAELLFGDCDDDGE